MDLNDWLDDLAAELGLGDLSLSTDDLHIILDLARDAAHSVQRPAAPLSAFLVGVAVGRGASLGASAATATARALHVQEAEDPDQN